MTYQISKSASQQFRLNDELKLASKTFWASKKRQNLMFCMHSFTSETQHGVEFKGQLPYLF